MSRIRDVYPGPGSAFFFPGSWLKKAPDPDPGSTTGKLSILRRSRRKDLGYLSWIRIFFHPETGLGSRGQESSSQDLGSKSATLRIGNRYSTIQDNVAKQTPKMRVLPPPTYYELRRKRNTIKKINN